MNLLSRAAKCRQLTMYVSLHVMSDFAESMQAIVSRSQIIPTTIQATVFPLQELVEESPFRPSEDHKSGQDDPNSSKTIDTRENNNVSILGSEGVAKQRSKIRNRHINSVYEDQYINGWHPKF